MGNGRALPGGRAMLMCAQLCEGVERGQWGRIGGHGRAGGCAMGGVAWGAGEGGQ